MIILNPIMAVLYLVHLGIANAAFFLVVRLVLTWKHFGWLAAFDKVGRPLVDGMTGAIGGRVSKRLSEKGKLLISLAILTLADIAMACLINAVR